jgi:very-short-patch-repair endonuclease
VIVTKGSSIDNFRKHAARRMRPTATASEARLWQHLRRHPMTGSHFRRQVVIGPYIADFACMTAKLIVEVDGSQHGEEAGIERDAIRTKWFEAEGYEVLRFWNNDVSSNIDGVLSTIHTALSHRSDDLTSMKHKRRNKSDHRALPADPPPPGEGKHARRPRRHRPRSVALPIGHAR